MGVIGSNTTKISDFVQESVGSSFQNINRLSLLHLITSIPTGVLNVRYKTSGPTLTVNTACASGLSAVVQAAKYVKYNEADIVLAGGVEDSYNPI
jgi:3-oxoacyl-[acyl-carrier-protein] synthase II